MPNKPEAPQTREVDLFAAAWQGLGSLKFAAVLLLLFTAASLLGTFIPQGQSPEQYVATYGEAKAHVMEALRITDLYHSAWYNVLMGLIVLSTIACTISRYKLTTKRGDIGEADFGFDRVKAMRASREIAATDRKAAAERIVEALRRAGYRSRTAESNGLTCIVADKWRIGNWGMFMLHASLLVIAAGAILGAARGFTGYSMIVTEGQSSNECSRRDYAKLVPMEDPHTPGQMTMAPSEDLKTLPFSVLLENFRVGVNKKGNPTSYESQVRVIDRGKSTKEFTIATNRPLSYRGIRFYQNDFSMSAITIRVIAPDGTESLTTWPVSQEYYGGGQQVYQPAPTEPLRILRAPDDEVFVVPGDVVAPNYDPNAKWDLPTMGDLPANPGILLLAHKMSSSAAAQMPDTIGWITQSQSQKYQGYTFELADVTMQSVLGVGRNPGLPIIYFGFTTFLLGMILAFYVSHRIVRVCISDDAGRTTAVIGGAARLGEVAFGRVFDAIEKAASA